MALSHFSMSGAVRSTSGPHHPVVLPSSRRSCFGLRPAGAATTDHQKRLVVSLRSEPLSSGGGGSSLDTEVVATVGQVTEVNKDTFWSIVNSAGDKIVVLDMYTQWCGPCKVMAPKFQHLAEKYDDVVFLKLDCNQDNSHWPRSWE